MSINPIIDSNKEFLKGPNSRGQELLFAGKVFWQFIKGFRALHFMGPCITVFGSARFSEGHPTYEQARKIGSEIAAMGFVTMTGGGPGVMEAANRGAYESGGKSVGCTIKLPKEQSNNAYMHKFVHFEHFFVRKVLLLKYSYAFIVCPGGFGTLDELFETLTLIQTGIIHNFPMVIMDKAYYGEVSKLIDKMIQERTISEADKELILFTDDVSDAMNHIKAYIKDHYIVSQKKSQPFWWLGERIN